MVKSFTQEFDKLAGLIKSVEPFCFIRFSDGEVTILRNQPVVLGDGYFIQGDLHGAQKNIVPVGTYNEEEQKEFWPQKHGFFQKKLRDSFLFSKHNYIKGIPAQNCLDGGASWHFCMGLNGNNPIDDLSFANVMINDNYARFVYEIVPSFSDKKIVLVANEKSNVDSLPFKVSKFFPIGKNCMINDYYLCDAIAEWIEENNISNHLFLFAASSLSNLLGRRLFSQYPTNQYLDIGSSLGPFLKLTGWKGSRTYLNIFWSNPNNPPRQDVDIWN